jgi:hypothetical protein
MEQLSILVNGIDDVKEHFLDGTYLELMNAISKLHEIIENYQSDNQSSDDDISDYNSDYDIDDEDEDEEEPEIEMVDIESFLELRNYNENLLSQFIINNNLSNDFINSKFNLIDRVCNNYLNNNIKCNCCGDKYCSNSYESFINCKNIQKAVLNYPLLLVIYYSNQYIDNEVIDDINKYKLFQFDGKINKNKYNYQYNNIGNIINLIPKLEISKLKLLLFVQICYLTCNNYLFLNNNIKYRNSIFNKIINENNSEINKNNIKYWNEKLNINQNIFDNMINSFRETFEISC